MLSSKMTGTPTLILIALSLFSTVLSKSATSPDVCLYTLDCPPTSYCNNFNDSIIPRCTRRLPKNAVCPNVGLGECRKGLTCTFDESIREFAPVCRPRAPRGGKCRLDAIRPCQDSLICDRETLTCQPLTPGVVGDPCKSANECQQDNGFYCQRNPGVCTPKRGPGGLCNRRENEYHCLGFCVSRRFDGVCISARKEGELCSDTDHCENRFFSANDPRADNLLCNVPQGSVGNAVGRCVRESRLLKRLGAKCNPHYDRCDRRRALGCRRIRRGRHVCQHRSSRSVDDLPRFCVPHSRLSNCPWGETKKECRLERVVPGLYTPVGPRPFFLCLRRSEKVPRGGVCITEYAACARGTECREVPGVKPETSDQFTRFRPQRVAFCVRIVKQGGSCGDVKNKFTTQCANGLRCEKGKCVKSEKDKSPFDETVTHGGLQAFCDDLPCAPGLVCEKSEFDSKKRCVLPLRIVGRGETCVNRAGERRRCKSGLVCAFRKDGTNVKRCRKPRKAGQYCREDQECEKGLVCPFVWTGNREQEERRCYDPNKTLSIGQTCDPNARGSQPRCVVNERQDELFPGGPTFKPMRCMKKGEKFACREVVGLFQLCNEATDVTCDSGFKCSRFGVCVPKGEA